MVSGLSGNNVFTGRIGSPLGDSLIEAIQRSDRLDIISAFVKTSALGVLKTALKDAKERKVRIRLITGTYLDITDPDAISELKETYGPNISIRFYNGDESFHPKAYLTYSSAFGDQIFVGSSNLSRSALFDGIEWNYRFSRKEHSEDFAKFEDMFNHIWNEHSYEATDDAIREYKSNRRPQIRSRLYKGPDGDQPKEITANDVQTLACLRLERTRSEGMDKGMVVAATGTGKTYLAALDSRGFSSVLFIAHNRQILKQARKAFETVRPGKTCGFCFDGTHDINADFVFATVQTLSKKEFLDTIDPDRFEYIVIDEFHHASSGSYRRVIDHFRPRFLLGLTATPERMDCQEVFALCDNNVVYEIRLLDAVREGYLCNFKYKGIADIADYSKIKFVNGHYDADELEIELSKESRAKLVFDKYRLAAGSKTVGFCSSIGHADYMCDYFRKRGIRAAASSSGSSSDYAIDQDKVEEFFNTQEKSVIFVVDIFNEGVDIPAIDTVMFLRPTESMTIFIQQLGRGLRLSPEKEYLTVLDFIGDYRNADMFPRLVTGGRPKGPVDGRSLMKQLPPGCDIDYDLETIDLYQKMYDRYTRIEDKLGDAFTGITETLGYVPTRVELFNYLPKDISDAYKIQIRKAFGDYLRFVSKYAELDPIRASFLENDAGRYINCLEQTGMSRMYKLPVFLAFIHGNRMTTSATFEEIGASMKEFYSRNNNSIEFLNDADRDDVREWSLEKWIALAKANPIKYLTKTHPDIFALTDTGVKIVLDIGECSCVEAFISEIRDIIEYRSLYFKDMRYKRD